MVPDGMVDELYDPQPSAQALLVIDMQNAFCHPEGSFARLGYDVSGCREAIAGCSRLLDAARRSGVPVLFVTYAYRPGYADGGYLVARMHPEVVRADGLVHGTWDVEVVEELAPGPGEVHLYKNRYSAFVGTDLADRLHALGTTAVTVCGVTTNVCVEGTARDAAQLDFGVTVVADAVGEIDRVRGEGALNTIRHAVGRVLPVDDVAAGWRASAQRSVSA